MARVRKYHRGGKGPGHPHPAGYTAPVIPGLTDNNPLIQLVDAPRNDRLSEFDEVKKADWSTILANPMQAWKHISKNGFTRPTQAELNAQGSNIYDGVMSMFNPAAYVEAVKGLDSSLTAADEALLSGIEDGRLSPGDLSKVIGDLSDAGMQALFLTIAPTAGKTLLGAAKELRRPALNTLTQEFRGSRLLGETKGVEPVPSSPLQQLTGERQRFINGVEVTPPKVKGKGKGKKYEPSNPYQDSNVAKTITEGGNWSTTNAGVYQYPSFMTGSKLEGQVSAKDGTISRSTLEQLVKNKNTKPSEAIAVEKILDEFEGKRIPYGNFKQSLALDIRPAEIVKTDEYAGTGVESLGYAQGVVDVTAKTNLYKDKSLGLTKEGESHFPDQPHSFWIRSMSTAEEPNVLKALEWQTDVKSLKDPSKGLLVSDDASNYSNLFESSDYSNLNHQIDTFKEEIRLITNVYPFIGQKGVVVGESILPKEIVDDFAMLKKGLQIAEDHKKESLILAKAAAKGLPLKFVNESLLDAARQGKEYLDVPTAETVFTIEGWTKPNNAELEPLARNQHDILRAYDNSLTNVSEHRLHLLEDLTDEIKSSISINNNVESLINKRVKVQKKAYDQLVSNIENYKPIPVSILNDLNFDSGMQEYVFSKLKEISNSEKLRERLYPGDFGLKEGEMESLEQKITTQRKDFITYIKNLKSETGIKAKQDITKFKEAQKKIDEIKAKGFDLSKISESEMSVTKNYRNFPKLWRSEFGTDVKQVTDSKGNNWMRVKIPENFYQNDISLPPSEIKTYRKGGKALKGLMKKYGAGGSVSDFGAQGNFTNEYTSNQPDVEELEDPNLILEENVIDAEAEGQVPIAPTVEEENKMKEENKVERGFSGAAKGVSVGSLFGPLGSLVGGAIGGIAGFLKGKKRERRQKGKDGMKIKKLMPSYQEGGEVSETEIDDGGLFQRLRDNRAERRINKTPVRQARTSELLDVLASDQPTTKGRYYPKEKEIVMYRDDDPDTLKHEQVHAYQYGPLQRLAYSLKFNDSARIQDPAKRKAYRKLTRGKNIVDDRQFNFAGQYLLSKGEEFEAVLDTGVNAAKEQGVDFSKSYDDILSQLLNATSPTNNMKGLMKFMDNKFTKDQRDLILKSIR